MFRQISWFCNGIVKKIGQVLSRVELDRIIWYPRFVFETIVFRVMFEKVCTEQFFESDWESGL